MIYLIAGQQNIRLKSQLKNIIKQSIGEIDPFNYVKYDGASTLVQDIVDDANSMPLGCDNKVIAVDNCYFLLKKKQKNKIESEQDYDELLNYLNEPNEMCDLVFLVNTLDNDLDKNNKLLQAIDKNGRVIILNEPTKDEWPKVVARFFKEKWPETTIDSMAIDEIARRTDGDYASLYNNGNKLALYTDHITFNDVTLLITRPLEDNIFDLFNFLLKDRNIDAVALFRDLKSANIEPATLISNLGNQFRILNNVSYLAKQGLDNDSIASELKINPTRAKILRRNVALISQKRINQILDELYQLDLQIKSGLVDRYYSFELFLINFKRN